MINLTTSQEYFKGFFANLLHKLKAPASVVLLLKGHNFSKVLPLSVSVCPVDNLIRKKSQDPIGLQRQGVIVNYIPKFQVATMSLEVA